MNRVVAALLMLTMVASAESSFTGRWEGKMNELPGVALTIRDVGSNVGGSIVFYFQQRGENGKWHVGGKDTEPLLVPETHDKVLTFEVRHHKFHGSADLGPNVKFRMELTGTDEGVLHYADNDAGPAPLKLLRQR